MYVKLIYNLEEDVAKEEQAIEEELMASFN
jgi:hypothetical protein